MCTLFQSNCRLSSSLVRYFTVVRNWVSEIWVSSFGSADRQFFRQKLNKSPFQLIPHFPILGMPDPSLSDIICIVFKYFSNCWNRPNMLNLSRSNKGFESFFKVLLRSIFVWLTEFFSELPVSNFFALLILRTIVVA